jgi:hypothetical protein
VNAASGIYVSRTQLADAVSPAARTGSSEAPSVDASDDGAIAAAAKTQNIATNPGLTAGVQLSGYAAVAKGQPIQQSSAADCLPAVERGLAQLGSGG